MDDKEKIRALLEGLQIQDIDMFMKDAKVGDYRNLGTRYHKAAMNLKTQSTNKDKVNLKTKYDKVFLYDIYEITKIVEYANPSSFTPILGKQYRAKPDEIPELGLQIWDRRLLGYRFIVQGKLIQERDKWGDYLRGVDKEDLVEWDKPYYDIEMEKLNNN